MKTKSVLSLLTLLLFVFLGGGSASENDFGMFVICSIAGGVIVVICIAINNAIENKYKEKRLRMIEVEESKSDGFDRRVSIGDDRCKIYFDSNQKKVMIMRVTTQDVDTRIIDDFVCTGLATYDNPVYNAYDTINRKLLTGTFGDYSVNYQVVAIGEQDKNKDVVVNNTIPPIFRTLQTTSPKKHKVSVFIDECRGVIATTESGSVKSVFNYINSASLPRKRGEKSTTTIKLVGNYMFIIDNFLKVLVIINPITHNVFNFSDILDVTYEENGTQLYSKSTSRTVGGALVGGVLMGGAGAVVGGLSGASSQSKEVRSIDIKILLRNTDRPSYVLHFKDEDRTLNTKNDSDRTSYERYVKNATQAKDIFSVIIDSAKQVTTHAPQPVVRQTSNAGSSVADELTKLAKLKADGILTEEEFQAQKAKLLG